MTTPPPVHEHFVLRTIPPGQASDLMVFRDAAHACRWLREHNATDATYTIARQTLEAQHGDPLLHGYLGRQVTELTPTEFLAQYGTQEGTP